MISINAEIGSKGIINKLWSCSLNSPRPSRRGLFCTLLNPGIPKFGSSNRDTGSSDENKAVVQGSLFYFGTCALSPSGTLSFEIEGSSFPNWIHVNQERMISSLTANELRWTNPAASVGGTAETTWKRTK